MANMETAEKIRIYFSDDSKIKSFGEVLTSDSGRTILRMLLLESMTANQLAQNTGISLQLVKYHINKMEKLGIIRVSKIEKNSKSHDMKYYIAEKFAIMILPQTEMEKAKNAVKKIYKIGAIGIAAALSWFAIQIAQPAKNAVLIGAPQAIKSTNPGSTLEESLKLAHERVMSSQMNPTVGSGTPFFSPDSVVLEIIVIGAVFGILSTILYWKAVRYSKITT